MNFSLTEDQEEIRRVARDVFAARYPLPGARERGSEDAHWAEMVELGFPALALGEEGLGRLELALVAEQLGYALAPSALASTWAAAALGLGERLIEGARGTVAVADGSPAVEADGAGKLTGVKVAVPDATTADWIVVSAGERLLAVAGDAAGVSVAAVESLDSARPLGTVTLDGAAGEELRLDDAGQAWSTIAVAAAAEAVGTAARAMEMAVAYAKERTQFSRPVGTYQAVSHPCAQMFLEVEGARAVVAWAAWALDHDPAVAPRAAACAKAYASDAGVRVTRAALQVHGGIGFTWEHDLHLLLKRAEVLSGMYGDAGAQRELVAAAVLA